MKRTGIILFSLLTVVVFVHGQTLTTNVHFVENHAVRTKILLTSNDVIANTVRIITPAEAAAPNLVFKYRNMSPEQIAAIRKQRPIIQVVRHGEVVAETAITTGMLDRQNGKTNLVGLVLLFDNYKKAKLAEAALRGE